MGARFFTVIVVSAISCAVCQIAQADEPPRHVVLIVWDGMRPDFVTEKYAPTLDKLAHDGVRFQNHHSVYPTATNVNGAALATGCYPNRNGVSANLEFRPAINSRHPIDTGDPDSIKRGDEISGGKYLALPTIAELVRNAGKKVAIAGSKSVAILHDRHNEWMVVKAKDKPLTIFAGAPVSTAIGEELVKQVGPFLVESSATAAQRDKYTTRVLTEILWRDDVAAFSLLWLSEPDLSQHNFAPGSPEALAAIKSADDNLAIVLRALDEKHARDTTDVFVVSDHGFSTIRRSIDVIALLSKAGFHAAKEFSEARKPGDILVSGNGGSVLFYVEAHDAPTVQRLVEWLQKTDFAGILFARDCKPIDPLSFGRIDTSGGADVVMSFRWSDEKNQFGVSGLIDADWNRKAGQGTHATLSPFDVHNMLIAAGPHIRRKITDQLPSGNVDLAPTILHILGIAGPSEIDGRELTEALAENTSNAEKRENDGKFPIFGGGQRLMISKAGDKMYLDEGRANDLPKGKVTPSP